MKAVGKGADARVLFNFRASKLAMQIRRLILSGAVGKVLQVQYESHLDTTHGADYFRRWHRRRENSGGLLVHKSSHDFDFIGWLLDDVPTRVRATGGLVFYGPENGIPAPRCSTCPRSSMCPFYFDLSAGVYRKFYKDFEVHDGYFRDGCVFSEDIDIEDRAEVLVEYRRGASLSYCIDAFSPYEGTRLVIVGSEGRLEAEDFDGAVGIHAGCHIYRLRTYDRFGNETEIHVPIAQGEHEGADRKILCDILRPETSDPLGIKASLKDGILSSAVGVAAGLSIRQGGMVEIESLFQTP
jgi:predicted dehydrogenase